jgi:hypothetical protein
MGRRLGHAGSCEPARSVAGAAVDIARSALDGGVRRPSRAETGKQRLDRHDSRALRSRDSGQRQQGEGAGWRQSSSGQPMWVPPVTTPSWFPPRDGPCRCRGVALRVAGDGGHGVMSALSRIAPFTIELITAA